MPKYPGSGFSAWCAWLRHSDGARTLFQDKKKVRNTLSTNLKLKLRITTNYSYSCDVTEVPYHHPPSQNLWRRISQFLDHLGPMRWYTFKYNFTKSSHFELERINAHEWVQRMLAPSVAKWRRRRISESLYNNVALLPVSDVWMKKETFVSNFFNVMPKSNWNDGQLNWTKQSSDGSRSEEKRALNHAWGNLHCTNG